MDLNGGKFYNHENDERFANVSSNNLSIAPLFAWNQSVWIEE